MQTDNFAERRLCGRHSKAHDDSRLDSPNLGFKPWAAGRDLGCRWFLMLAAFALRFPFEMFHGIREVDSVPRNARFCERLVQQSTCRTDERTACAVLLISRLFSNHQDLGVNGAFSKYGLSGALIEVAAGA